MGAVQFETTVFASTPEKAFASAVEAAHYMHGHGGYTGTIAEKDGFRVFDLPARLDADKFVSWVQGTCGDDKDMRRLKIPTKYRPLVKRVALAVDDKWGPAGAVKLNPKHQSTLRKRHGRTGRKGAYWTFFGWASH